MLVRLQHIDKYDILKKARMLKQSQKKNKQLRRLIVASDLTKKERELQLRNELREKQQKEMHYGRNRDGSQGRKVSAEFSEQNSRRS